MVTPGGSVSTFFTGTNPRVWFSTAAATCTSPRAPPAIVKVAPGGGSSTTFASGLFNPQALAFDSSGNLYVSESSNGDVVKVTPGGSKSTFASGLSTPIGLAFDSSGNLYVAEGSAGGIVKVTPGGSKSVFASGFSSPRFIAFAATGSPEPSSLLLVGLGALGLGGLERRRRRIARRGSSAPQL